MLIEFINSHENWQELLSDSPYNIKIKQDGEYFLLKYDQLNSPKDDSIVKECRGPIVWFDSESDEWIYVCRPFTRFFNYGEECAAKIDWKSARVLEKVDGCFTARDKVMLADGTSMEIGDIVKNKMNVEVMSYNQATKQIEPKRVIGWKVSDKPAPLDQWRTIKLKGIKTSLHGKLSQHNIITPTLNHVFFRKNKITQIIEEVTADQLQEGDILYTPKFGLTNIEKQVILGTLLGDGSLTYYQEQDLSREKGIRFAHSREQKEYVWYKFSLLKQLGGQPVDKEIENSFGKEKTFYQSFVHSGISSLYHLTYTNYKKRVTRQWLEELDWLGFSIWYMDDGHYDKAQKNGSLSLHTEGFSIEENNLIHKFYEEKGYKNYIRDDKKGHFYIHFSTQASEKIWQQIAKYIPKCMDYKLPERFQGHYEDLIDKQERPIVLCEGYIENIEEGLHCHNTYHAKSVLRYDIEVEDNHNYFCQGCLVHNSLIKVWYHNGWHVSTSGTIDAEKSECGDLNYLELFLRAAHLSRESWDQNYANKIEEEEPSWYNLNTQVTYLFELVSPWNKLVVPYSRTELYYLGEINNVTGQEMYRPDRFYSKEVKCFADIDSLEAAVNAANDITAEDGEGFVVVDKYFNRIKIKGADYLRHFYYRNNGIITTRRVILAMQESWIDDLWAYNSDAHQMIVAVMSQVMLVGAMFDDAFKALKERGWTDQKEYAEFVKSYPKEYWAYLFYARKISKPLGGMDWLLQNKNPAQIEAIINNLREFL